MWKLGTAAGGFKGCSPENEAARMRPPQSNFSRGMPPTAENCRLTALFLRRALFHVLRADQCGSSEQPLHRIALGQALEPDVVHFAGREQRDFLQVNDASRHRKIV